MSLVRGLAGLAGLLAACSNGGQVATAPADAAPSGILRPSSVAAIASVRQVHVSISDAGCAPQAIQLPARPATFHRHEFRLGYRPRV